MNNEELNYVADLLSPRILKTFMTALNDEFEKLSKEQIVRFNGIMDKREDKQEAHIIQMLKGSNKEVIKTVDKVLESHWTMSNENRKTIFRLALHSIKDHCTKKCKTSETGYYIEQKKNLVYIKNNESDNNTTK
jgi:hypothetical protein